MRSITLGILLFCLNAEISAANPPLVEKYLHAGELARGEQVLQSELAAAPDNNQVRLSLGMLQVFRGVERLGQALHEYGCETENNHTPFLRLPLPANADPSPITYQAFRRVLDRFRSDLETAEATLAKVTDDDFKLPLRLADIHLDLDGNGKAEETLTGVLKKLMGPAFRFSTDNPDFLVCFDRGDVPWLRAYCHVLMAMLEFQLAYDGERMFELTAHDLFAAPKIPADRKSSDPGRDLSELWKVIVIKDPARLGRFRQHMLAVCDLNHATWRYIRMEQDDDHEWLPNAKQKGVIGLPVSNEMIDAWLGMIDEFKALLDGQKFISPFMVQIFTSAGDDRSGLNVKELLDNPPDRIDWEKIQNEGIEKKYLFRNGKDVDFMKMFRVTQVFNNTLAVGYAAWFN